MQYSKLYYYYNSRVISETQLTNGSVFAPGKSIHPTKRRLIHVASRSRLCPSPSSLSLSHHLLSIILGAFWQFRLAKPSDPVPGIKRKSRARASGQSGQRGGGEEGGFAASRVD